MTIKLKEDFAVIPEEGGRRKKLKEESFLSVLFRSIWCAWIHTVSWTSAVYIHAPNRWVACYIILLVIRFWIEIPLNYGHKIFGLPSRREALYERTFTKSGLSVALDMEHQLILIVNLIC